MTKSAGAVPKIDYSIVIPSYNASRTIVACLTALEEQIDFGRTEIVVVDSSKDETPDLIRAQFPRVRLTHSEQRLSAGKARNIGIEQAKGDLLLFIDSDCVAAPGWFEGMIRAHEKYDCAAVGGGVQNGNPESLFSWAGYFLEFSRFFPNRRAGRFVTHHPTCNISYKRSIFDRFGTFPVDLYPVEDRVFNQRLALKGERIVFEPHVQVSHHHRSTFKGLVRHQQRIGKGSARMRKLSAFKASPLLVNRFLLPITLPLMLLARFGFVGGRLVLLRPDLLFMWLLSLPLYLVGVLVWLGSYAAEICRRDATES